MSIKYGYMEMVDGFNKSSFSEVIGMEISTRVEELMGLPSWQYGR